MSRPVGRATLIRLTEKQWQGVDAYSDSWHYKSRAETIRAMIDQALERERMRLYQAGRRRRLDPRQVDLEDYPKPELATVSPPLRSRSTGS